MSNAIDSFYTLCYSPYVLAPIFEGFFSTADRQKNNFLLSYLVLPLTLYPASRAFLKNSRKNSSLTTFWHSPERFYGLAERVGQCREITNICIQCCIDSESVAINEDLIVTVSRRSLDASASPPDAIRAAEKLGDLLKPLNVPSVYRLLGVKSL